MGNLLNYLSLGKNLFRELSVLEGMTTRTTLNAKGIKSLSEKNSELGEIFQKMFEGSQKPSLELTMKSQSNYTIGGILLKDGEKTLSRGAVSISPPAGGEQLIKGHVFDSEGVGKAGFSTIKDAKMSPVREFGQEPVKSRITKAVKEKQLQLLFTDLDTFIASSMSKLDEFKAYIPEELYSKLKLAIENRNFSLNNIIKEYYSKLSKCKTLKEVEQFYPEFKVGKLDYESEICNRIKEVVPKHISEDMAKYATYEDKLKYVTEEINKHISEQAKQWPIQDVIENQIRKIADNIINGNFVGKCSKNSKALNTTYPIRYNFIEMENKEQIIIDMIKKLYLDNLSNNEAIGASMLKSLGSSLDYIRKRQYHDCFRKVMRNIEDDAIQFKGLGEMSEKQLLSAIYTKSWRTSGLNKELQSVAKRSMWPRIKAVWIKTLYPNREHIYTTDNLIEAYLKARYSCGNINVESANPLTRYFEEGKTADKFKFVSRIYALCDRPPEIPLHQLSKFEEFKSKFDIEAMKEDVEKMEKHYKNAFFKMFWNDRRTAAFIDALRQNKAIANKNIEATDSILTKAMDEIMLEI